MNSLTYPIVAGLCLIVTACMTTAEKSKFSYLGDIPAACPITFNTVSESAPERFRITPVEAVRVASEQSWVKCNSIFQQQLYADDKNYYIIKSAFGRMSEESEAVIVNGVSGKVSVRDRK